MKVPAGFRVGIARYQPADADDLARFQHRTFGGGSRQVDAARVAWLDRNPCRAGDSRDMWICRRDGAIVGQQAEIPFELRIGPHQRRAHWAIDLMVDDAWRLRGVGPALVATQLEQRPLLAGMNMSEQGLALYSRAGLTDLGIVPVYLRPLDIGRAARLAPVPRRVRRVAPLATPALR
ncbi:MAG: GNAT family N-acetyltransferase, partial [Acidimicrobiales bacterium]